MLTGRNPEQDQNRESGEPPADGRLSEEEEEEEKSRWDRLDR